MSDKSEPSLSLVVQAEMESQAMLEASRREAQAIRQKALEQAARLLDSERAKIEAAAQAAYAEALEEGERRLKALSEDGARRVESLRERIESRSADAVRAIVDITTSGVTR